MFLDHLCGLGLAERSNTQGTFATFPQEVQRAVATPLVMDLSSNFDAAVPRSLRSVPDCCRILEAIGPVFGLPVHTDGPLIQTALRLYFRLLHPQHARLLPDDMDLGSEARDAFIIEGLRQVSQVFDPIGPGRGGEAHRQLVLLASNLVSAFVAHNEPYVKAATTWEAIAHIPFAVLQLHTRTGAFPDTRPAVASVALEVLLRGRCENPELWALVRTLLGAPQAARATFLQWRALVTALTRAMVPLVMGRAAPGVVRVDWHGISDPVRSASHFRDLTGPMVVFMWQALLRLVLDHHADLVGSDEAELEVAMASADVAVLLSAAALWPGAAGTRTDEDLYNLEPQQCPVSPPLFPTSSPSLSSVLAVVELPLRRILARASPSIQPHSARERAVVVSSRGLCAAVLRRECVSPGPLHMLAVEMVPLLQGSTLAVRGHVLVATQSFYAMGAYCMSADFGTALLATARFFLTEPLADDGAGGIGIQDAPTMDDVDAEGSAQALLTEVRRAACVHIISLFPLLDRDGRRAALRTVHDAVKLHGATPLRVTVLSAAATVLRCLESTDMASADAVAPLLQAVLAFVDPDASPATVSAALWALRSFPLQSPLCALQLVAACASYCVTVHASLQEDDALTVVSVRLFVLACRTASDVMSAQTVLDRTSGRVPLFVESHAVAAEVLSIVDAASRTVSVATAPAREAALALLHSLNGARLWPLAHHSGAVCPDVDESVAGAPVGIHCLSIGRSRLVSVIECVDKSVLLVLRDPCGRAVWRCNLDDASCVTEPCPVSESYCHSEERHVPVPQQQFRDLCRPAAEDKERVAGVIAAWKGDAVLAEALQRMGSSELEASELSDPSSPPLPPDAAQGPASGLPLVRRLLSDLGLVSQRARALPFDHLLAAHCKLIDAASTVDAYDVDVVFVGESPHCTDGFLQFAAALGVDAGHGGSLRVSELPSRVMRFHIHAATPLTLPPPSRMRVIWDATRQRYDYASLPCALHADFARLCPQWDAPRREHPEVVVTPLGDGLSLLRGVSPPGPCMVDATPFFSCDVVMGTAAVPAVVANSCHLCLSDGLNAAGSSISDPVTTRRRLLTAALDQAMQRSPLSAADNMGSQLLVSLLAE